MEKKKFILLGVLFMEILIFCTGMAMETLVNIIEEGSNIIKIKKI